MKPIYIGGVGVCAPGLAGWRESAAVLTGKKTYVEAPLSVTADILQPRSERRRATPVAKLALSAAAEAVKAAQVDPKQLRAVFASSSGDVPVFHKICMSLLEEDRLISPTDFQNSVHNAVAGYWAIANGCLQSSLSLSAFDATFSVGLLEAATAAVVEYEPVLLVAYDHPPPYPLIEKRPITVPFSVSLLLRPTPGPGDLASFSMRLSPRGGEDGSGQPELERLRKSNPAARALPLLQAIACQEWGTVRLPYPGAQALEIEVRA